MTVFRLHDIDKRTDRAEFINDLPISRPGRVFVGKGFGQSRHQGATGRDNRPNRRDSADIEQSAD